mgnify:CR=1 FL=1
MTPSEWLAVANVVVVVVLTVITGWYAWSTAQMLRQLKEQTEASRKQALTAERTLQHLLQVAEEQRGTASTVVRTTIEAAIANMEHWRGQNLVNLANLHAVPQVVLVPESGTRAIEHARTVSPNAATPLSQALSILEQCESEFEMLSGLGRRSMVAAERQSKRIYSFFDEARKLLDLAKQLCK